MKIRCQGCGKVIKTSSAGASGTCPECGSQLAATTAPPPPAPTPPGDAGPAAKGKLPTEHRAARNIGCLAIGVLVFGVPVLIAIVTEDETAYWVLAVCALILLIPVGIWLERHAIRRE